MSDRTALFKATIKTVKSRQKSEGLSVGPDRSILGSTRRKGDFIVKSKEMVKNITKMRDFLMENRKAYISASSLLICSGPLMTDSERDQIDTDAEVFMRTCSETIRLFKQDAAKKALHSQRKEHQNSVFALIDAYLKDVCRLYSEQKAVRVKRVVDRKKLSRLEPERKKRANDQHIKRAARSEVTRSDTTVEHPSEGTAWSGGAFSHKAASQPALLAFDNEPRSPHPSDDELSPEEIQMFEQENKQLFHDMNSMVDEVRQVEKQVVEVARLQEILAEKVLEQEPQVEQIADTVVGSTENIKEGNEEIREAMKNNAGLRVWILFFIIVLSFSLLFLDWYNP